MIVARSSADSCSKCLVITTPINVEVLHLILDSAQDYWQMKSECLNTSTIFRWRLRPIWQPIDPPSLLQNSLQKGKASVFDTHHRIRPSKSPIFAD